MAGSDSLPKKRKEKVREVSGRNADADGCSTLSCLRYFRQTTDLFSTFLGTFPLFAFAVGYCSLKMATFLGIGSVRVCEHYIAELHRHRNIICINLH